MLELRNLHMFSFNYKLMEIAFDCELSYSDTDWLLYEINHVELFTKLKKNENLKKSLYFSNYPQNLSLHHNGNRMVTLLFKNDMVGKIDEEFVGLKLEVYSISMEINKNSPPKAFLGLRRQILNTIFTKQFYERPTALETKIYGSDQLHQLETISSNKISLSAFDNKRCISENGIKTVPFGYYLMRHIVAFRELLADLYCGEENAASPDWETFVREDGTIHFDNRSNRTLSPPNTPLRARDAHDNIFY